MHDGVSDTAETSALDMPSQATSVNRSRSSSASAVTASASRIATDTARHVPKRPSTLRSNDKARSSTATGFSLPSAVVASCIQRTLARRRVPGSSIWSGRRRRNPIRAGMPGAGRLSMRNGANSRLSTVP